jgi:hypothetical protein
VLLHLYKKVHISIVNCRVIKILASSNFNYEGDKGNIMHIIVNDVVLTCFTVHYISC